jgi:hypothetical protein
MDFKLYNPDGECMGAAKYAEDAAAFVACLGEGATVRIGRDVVWLETDEQSASESFDAAAEVMLAHPAAKRVRAPGYVDPEHDQVDR